MKILMVNASDINGGAARAAYRLHRALLDQNIDSQMLVQEKNSSDHTVICSAGKMGRAMEKMKIRLRLDQLPLKFYKNRTKTSFSPAWLPWSNIVNKINEINPHIVHLHLINSGMIRIEDLMKIKIPIVWSLHDNWAFTGGCHVKWECERYKDECGLCPRLDSHRENDLSRIIWRRKNKVYPKIDKLTLIGLSKWINECSKESSLLKNKKHINLPNPIDTSIYKPFKKEYARELLNLPKNKKLLLFGAMSSSSAVNKGFSLLKESLDKLEYKNLELVIFGSNKPKEPQNLEFKTHYMGHLNDDVSLVVLYNAVDVMVVPSLQENLSNVIMESLACATPVVGFDAGGNCDMIEHRKNGYLAKPFDIEDLVNGIEWILNNESYDNLCREARKKVLEKFDSTIVAKKYIDVYKEILNEK